MRERDAQLAGPQDRSHEEAYDQQYDQRGGRQHPYRKKKSFLSELFDD